MKKNLKKPVLKAARKGKAPSDKVPKDTNFGGDKGSRANFWGWSRYFWREYLPSPQGLPCFWHWNKMAVSSNSFLSKVLDDPTDWTARPYSVLEGGLPPLFTFLESVFISHYRDTPCSEVELSFVTCAFPSHLQACFQDEYETQTYNPHRFSYQYGYDQGILGHFSILTLLAVVPSLAFKKENLIKILVSSSVIPFTSPTKNGLPLPRFKSWWFDIRERVRNFRKVVPNEWMSHLSFREI